MENAQNSNLEALRAIVGDLVSACTDADLLDLVYRLLVQSGTPKGI